MTAMTKSGLSLPHRDTAQHEATNVVMPPQLPPRRPSEVSSVVSTDTSTYRASDSRPYLSPNVAFQHPSSHPYQQSSGIDDPRSSSTQSLRPVHNPGDSRRKLLLVYIHGFMGSEASFQSFPAHVHSLLTMSLADSHIVHTKIYPKYQSRRDMSVARDDFSNWMYPHESSTTDVILLGHSIGGILGAEVVLEPSHTHGSSALFQHRIIGLVAYDTPFLGMHPGVVSTGIASLFRGAPEESHGGPQQTSLDSPSEVFESSQHDPNYNPAYTNDVHIPVRKNKWERAWYFWNKHADDLGKATKSYVKSHFEFGGCLADYPGLKRRYYTLRALEDIDDLEERQGPNGKTLRRVRFVNYYTASTGRIKEERSPARDGQLVTETEMSSFATDLDNTLQSSDMRSSTPRISFDAPKSLNAASVDTKAVRVTDAEADREGSGEMMTLEPTPHSENIEPEHPSIPRGNEALQSSSIGQSEASPLEDRAHEDTSNTPTAQTRRHDKEEEIRRLERNSTLNPEDYDRQLQQEIREGRKPKDGKKKDRKFCALPTKDSSTGTVDHTWIRVYMEGMDEVVAHTSLFNLGNTYAKLVGDTAERIRDWVQEDATINTLLLEKHMGSLAIGAK